MKQFLCKWGEGYIRQESKVLSFDEISPEYGWDEDCIKRLDNALVGEVVNCSDHSGLLYVCRVE
jgi:hypothetical protein